MGCELNAVAPRGVCAIVEHDWQVCGDGSVFEVTNPSLGDDYAFYEGDDFIGV